MYVALAQALGVSVEQLEAALEEQRSVRELANARDMDIGGIRSISSKAYRRIVLRALVEGLLTQDKANKLLAGELNEIDLLSECLRSSGDYKERLHAAAAETLKISVSDLEAAFSHDQTLRQLAEAHDVDIDEVRSAMKSVHQEQIRQAVNNGEINQIQAEQLQEQFTLAPWLGEDDLRDALPVRTDLDSLRRFP